MRVCYIEPILPTYESHWLKIIQTIVNRVHFDFKRRKLIYQNEIASLFVFSILKCDQMSGVINSDDGFYSSSHLNAK